MITGQLIFTDKGPDEHSGKKGHRLVMVYGILSMPEGSFEDQHQYTITDVPAAKDAGFLPLILHKDGAIDRKEEIRGQSASGALCTSIWRV